MADNIDVTPGTGKTVATDDVAGVQFQKVKLDIGGDGASTPVTDLATSAKQDTGNSSLSTIATNTGAALTDTQLRATPVPVSVSGVATASKQDTGNTSLASIDGKITAVNTGAVVLAAGSAAIGKLAANSGVDIGDVDVTSVAPGTGASSLGKAEDAAHSSGDVGVFVLGVRNDGMATLTSNDGDYNPIATTKSGRMLVTPAPAETMVRGLNSVAGTGDTAVTGTISGDAGLKTYITNIQVANTGSSNTLITFKDGNGGSALAYTIAPAGGGSNISFEIPLVTTANTALYFACGTSSTTVYVSAQGYKAP